MTTIEILIFFNVYLFVKTLQSDQTSCPTPTHSSATNNKWPTTVSSPPSYTSKVAPTTDTKDEEKKTIS